MLAGSIGPRGLIGIVRRHGLDQCESSGVS